jgi:hypothetical protein
MRPYLSADERLKSSSLDYTIIRPGSLTEDKGTGTIEAAEKSVGGVRSPRRRRPYLRRCSRKREHIPQDVR